MTLADIFNAPTELKLGDEVFRVAKPNQLQEGEFQRWLEQSAFDAINRRVYQRDEERLQSIRMHDQDCAIGTYEWGGALALARFQTRKGMEKFLCIICRDQGLTPEKAAQLVETSAAELIQAVRSKVQAEHPEGGSDPKALEETLTKLGSPSAFLLSALLCHPLTSPSTTSPGSTTTS